MRELAVGGLSDRALARAAQVAEAGRRHHGRFGPRVLGRAEELQSPAAPGLVPGTRLRRVFRGAEHEVLALYLERRAVLAVVRALAERRRLTKMRRRREGRNAAPDASVPAVPPWTKDMVLRVLRCCVYTGVIASGEDLYKGEHEPILDRETFDRVQRILDEHAGRPAVPGRNPDYLLTGRLRCGACSAVMTPASTRRGNRTYRFYCRITRDERQGGVPRPAASRRRDRGVCRGSAAGHGNE